MRAALAEPDLILLDIVMPGLDGFEACRRLKADADTRDVPVIFMTGLSDAKQIVSGFAVGGVDYITKPFQVEEVLARINTHIALRRANSELKQAYQPRKTWCTTKSWRHSGRWSPALRMN